MVVYSVLVEWYRVNRVWNDDQFYDGSPSHSVIDSMIAYIK